MAESKVANASETPTRKAPSPSAKSQRGLDWLNFFVADVETAFGPFVSVYLAQNGWGQGTIGTILTVNSAVALAVQTPAGALVDWTRRKRTVIAACLALIAAGSLLIGFFPTYLPVMAGEFMHGVTGGAVRTALAAIGLGLVGHRAYHTRVGRNHRYNSFGNAATALGMGALGHLVSPGAPFLAAAALCVPAYLALYLIDGDEIDYARARGAAGRKEPKAAQWRELARNRHLLTFAGCLFLFQFANASMLPLASERLAADYRHVSELVTAALVVVPQLVTALIATWIARKADERGRRWLLMGAFLALLIRAVLFALAFGPWFLVCVQVLGGLTAAVIGILSPLVVADLTKRTGRYNFSLGAVSMIAGIGATVSTTAMGMLAQSLGFTVGFLGLALVAGIGLAAVWLLMPETVDAAREED
ncbi:MAG: MFS transporter [Alphaproteobacteria bacterium]|nr:MFS transporter [Alphaproteobacteria bacterium]